MSSLSARLAALVVTATTSLGPTPARAGEVQRPVPPPSPNTAEGSLMDIEPSARPVPDPTGPPSVVTRRQPGPEALLADAAAALLDGDRDRARTLYRRIVREYPSAPQRWMLGRLLGVEFGRDAYEPARTWRPRDTESPTRRPRPERVHRDPREVPGWEAADYVITSMAYGLGIGIAYDAAWFVDGNDEAAVPVAVVAMATTAALAGVYLGVGEPDRGDLALTLTLVSDLPLSVLLIGFALDDSPGPGVAAAVAVAGTAAIPLAAGAAHNIKVDPGAMTLARELGFWGAAIAAAGTTGIGTRTSCSTWNGAEDCSSDPPSGRVVAFASLLGLYGGLTLGGIVGANTHVSVERARLMTLGGWGGALIGGIGGAAAYSDERALGVLAAGAALGLGVTFFATAIIDAPESIRAAGDEESQGFVPTLMPILDSRGKLLPAVGIGGSLF